MIILLESLILSLLEKYSYLLIKKTFGKMIFIISLEYIFFVKEPGEFFYVSEQSIFLTISTKIMKKGYLNITIALLRILSISSSFNPLIPFLSFSSIKSERYSGLLGLRLMKCSKSEVIICLKTRSSLKDSARNRSNLS